MNSPVVWLSCGVLQAELEQLHRDGRIRGELQFLDSMLHMDPERLQAVLEAKLTQLASDGSRVVLVYGDCCSRMLDLTRRFGVSRVNAINCAQMLVGRDRYRELMRDQAFMLLPEWAPRWKDVMQSELGLSPDVARDLMRENRRELVYLDTTVVPAPREALADCAAYAGLPCRIEKVALDHLLALLLQAESGNASPLPEKADATSSQYRKTATWADQVMMADVFSKILASADPSQLGRTLTEQLRELTGAHTAMFIAHPENAGSHRIIHVSPARRRSLFTEAELGLFCPDLTPLLPLYVKDYPPEHLCRPLLLDAGVSSLMRFPLQVGGELLATLLLLDLPGTDRINETEKIITHLVPVMALALKNSFAREEIERQAKELADYANSMERRVEKRTKDLRESEEKHRTLFENAGEGIFVAQDGMLVFQNPMTTQITGYSGEELTSRPFTDFIHAEDRSKIFDRYTRRLHGENIPRSYAFRVLHKSGRLIWVRLDTILIDWQGKPATLNFMADITKRKQAEEELQQSEERYRSIFENAQEGIYRTTLEGKFTMANQAMARILGYDSPQELVSNITDITRQLYVNPEDRIKNLELIARQNFVKGYELQFYRKDGRKIWVSRNMQAVRNERGQLLCLEGLVEDITDRKNSVDQLRKALGGTVQAIAMVVEAKDPYTAGHQRRVADISRAIAAEMGLPTDQIEGIRMAGIIHDIGKVSVPAEILSMPRKLTNLEFSLIKTHAQSGYDILKDIEFPWPIARMVLEHHERMNGSGYPNGLAGDDVLPESRILAVADVVEAMATYRPYRAALGLSAALEEIAKNRGILYDPEVADACLRLFQKKGFTIKE